MSYFAGIGGVNARDHTFRILKGVFAHEFSLKISWSNINTRKLSISKSTIITVITGI